MRLPEDTLLHSADLAAALFSALNETRPEAPAALLDSSDHQVSPTPERSRYSVLAFSFGPQREEVVHARGMTTVRHAVSEKGASEHSTELPFFQWLHQNWEILPDAGHPGEEAAPFQLGWVGWLGYEIKRELGSPDGRASAPRSTEDGLPETEAHLFRATHAVVVDHHRGELETQSLKEDPAWEQEVAAAVAEVAEAGLGSAGSASAGAADVGRGDASAESTAHPGELEAALRNLRVRDSQEEYLAAIRAAQEEIRNGTTYEVCLTTAVSAELHGSSPALELFARMRERNRAPFTQYLHLPGAQDPTPDAGAGTGTSAPLRTEILSTSPERYLSVTPGQGTSITVRSEPIKGTRPRGSTPEEDQALAHDLRTHPKDRAENVMITDLVRNDLSIHSEPGTLRTERLCAVESYPSVHQMVSTVSAQLHENAHPADVIAAAFPPGSMTGAPKISTMNILEELETGPRGAYSGVAGYFSRSGAADLSVLIRTAVITHDGERRRLHLGLGGAVTADSDPEAEWEEVRTKSAGVLGALGAEFPQR